MRLSGSTALITGGGKRLGRATALALASEGASVVVHYQKSEEAAEQCADAARRLGVKAWTIRADLADAEACEGLLDGACEQAGPIDILVNNASIFPRNTLLDMTLRDVAENVQVNAMAPFLLSRSLADQRRGGAIVNILDTRVVHHDRVHAAYHLSKRMLLTLTRMMALEFAPLVRVNAVAPGLILPPPGEDESYLQKMAGSVPLQRIGSEEEITAAIIFLLRSEFITGQVIFVDGGFHMKGSVYGL
jgi:NAD(P)-dependent dehydrogenase (short-subunit alcohol dehydrogenase family)